MREYLYYFVYILDYIMPLLAKIEKYSLKITIIIDLDYEEFKMNILEMIEDLFTNHYPCRLNKIFIVKINLETLTP
jgi:hypothetical protein